MYIRKCINYKRKRKRGSGEEGVWRKGIGREREREREGGISFGNSFK